MPPVGLFGEEKFGPPSLEPSMFVAGANTAKVPFALDALVRNCKKYGVPGRLFGWYISDEVLMKHAYSIGAWSSLYLAAGCLTFGIPTNHWWYNRYAFASSVPQVGVDLLTGVHHVVKTRWAPCDTGIKWRLGDMSKLRIIYDKPTGYEFQDTTAFLYIDGNKGEQVETTGRATRANLTITVKYLREGEPFPEHISLLWPASNVPGNMDIGYVAALQRVKGYNGCGIYTLEPFGAANAQAIKQSSMQERKTAPVHAMKPTLLKRLPRTETTVIKKLGAPCLLKKLGPVQENHEQRLRKILTPVTRSRVYDESQLEDAFKALGLTPVSYERLGKCAKKDFDNFIAGKIRPASFEYLKKACMLAVKKVNH